MSFVLLALYFDRMTPASYRAPWQTLQRYNYKAQSTKYKEPKRPMLLVIDNYDSFTYNLVQYLGELGAQVEVRRNNEVTGGEVQEERRPERGVGSAGAGAADG